MNNIKSAFKTMKTFMHWDISSAIINILFALFSLILVILSAVEGGNPGDSDYMISICSCCLAMMFVNFSFNLNILKINTRFFYSCPHSQIIITKLVPLFALVITLIFTVISVVSTSICLNIGTLTGNRLSDLFIALSFSMPLTIILSSLSSLPPYLCISIWVPSLPFYALIFVEENTDTFISKLSMNGFGLPLGISLLIFTVSVTASFFISMAIAKKIYSIRTTKYMQNLTTPAQSFK